MDQRTMKTYPRKIIQVLSVFAFNPFLQNLSSGTIFKGPSKHICVPGLNCYSCPAAALSCPVGSLQSVLSGRNTYVSTYVVGTLMLFGTIFGRFICGYLCPFGLYQEVLHAVPGKKISLPERLLNLGLLRYLFFFSLVILAPLLIVDSFSNGTAAFCAWICPAGTLQAGIPLMLTQPPLRQLAGALFSWKLFILALLSGLSIVLYRPFCRFVCPLGLIYGWFNRISLHQIRVDQHACTSCKICTKACKLQVNIYQDPGSSGCIRCGDCVRACPQQAITMGFDRPAAGKKNIQGDPNAVL